jgi:hypothetical protein
MSDNAEGPAKFAGMTLVADPQAARFIKPPAGQEPPFFTTGAHIRSRSGRHIATASNPAIAEQIASTLNACDANPPKIILPCFADRGGLAYRTNGESLLVALAALDHAEKRLRAVPCVGLSDTITEAIDDLAAHIEASAAMILTLAVKHFDETEEGR